MARYNRLREDIDYVDKTILSFIASGLPARLRDIKKYLDKKDITFYDHKGLDLRLQKLIDNKRIKKIPRGKAWNYPTYTITKKGIDDVGNDPYFFNLVSHFSLFRSYTYEILKGQNDREFLQGIINRVGAFFVYCYFKSWKLSSKKYSVEEKKNFRDTWVSNATNMKGFSQHMDTYLSNLWYLKNKKRYYGMDKQERDKEILKYSPKKAHELEKLILKKFPKEFESLDYALKRINKKDWEKIHFDNEKGEFWFIKKSSKS